MSTTRKICARGLSSSSTIRNVLHHCGNHSKVQQQGRINSWQRMFSTLETLPPLIYASKHKGPIVDQLWTLRLQAKQKAAASPDPIDMKRPRPPSESMTKITYDFESDDFLKEQYCNPFGGLRFGKVLEDLDALAGNIAFSHVQDPTVNIVTASVDRIRLSGAVDMDRNQQLSGKVTFVGSSSMEIRMQCKGDGEDDPWMEAYFTFVAVDSTTKKPMKIPPLDPQTWLEKDQFEAGQRRANVRKEARRKGQNFETAPLDPEIEKVAVQLNDDAGPLKNIPSLANPNAMLMEQTRLQNCEIAQPQTANLAHQIFGGFLMRRAFDLAYATTYLFAGCRPRFMEVDQVAFTMPVSVGDLTNFQSQIVYANVHDTITDFHLYQGQANVPIISVEVQAWVVQPAISSAKLSNKFVYTFAVDGGTEIRKILPGNMEQARKMATHLANRGITG
uniref:HotDog ACOT-type domain-containing protein n=2 Tax=Ditylum brightwellii TaxID=49249 RepID=A0A7S1YY04_9STRA|mmetsp:Transcript_20050/g.29880  ORF Transcript_20050/g.29880 Transcript_20050/m.29880 type:complete len:446 (+) Transcript_20050:128-1465(+)